jgi:hypothetical protein
MYGGRSKNKDGALKTIATTRSKRTPIRKALVEMSNFEIVFPCHASEKAIASSTRNKISSHLGLCGQTLVFAPIDIFVLRVVLVG